MTIPVINETFHQDIYAVSQVIDPENRTFTIELKVPATEKDVKPNMLAKLLVNDYINENALVVPENILQHTDKDYFIFTAIKENNVWKAHKLEVIPGKYYKNRIEILKGLKSGDHVILAGFQNLADGQEVKVDM